MSKQDVKNSEDRVKFFECAAGYLVWCNDNKEPANRQLSTLIHDICGLARQEECFSPRVSSYGKYWKG